MPISKIIISRVAITCKVGAKAPENLDIFSPSLNPTFIRHLFFSVFLLFEHALKKDYRVTKGHHRKPLVLLYPLCCQQLIKKEVKTISEQKHPNIFGIKELLKTDNTENLVAIPKKMTVRHPRKN